MLYATIVVRFVSRWKVFKYRDQMFGLDLMISSTNKERWHGKDVYLIILHGKMKTGKVVSKNTDL
jgi:hypothetical protein